MSIDDHIDSSARSEDNRWSRDRVCEESERCDNLNDVLAVRVCADGAADLHGGIDAEVRTELPRRRISRQPVSHKLVQVVQQRQYV